MDKISTTEIPIIKAFVGLQTKEQHLDDQIPISC